MKIKAQRRTSLLRYSIKPSELQATQEELIRYFKVRDPGSQHMGEGFRDPRRKITLQKANNEERKRGTRYIADIEYSPAVELSKKFMQFECHSLEYISHLKFPLHLADVSPSGLRKFKENWLYCEQNPIILKRNEEMRDTYSVEMLIPGTLENRKLTTELRSLGDRLGIPERNENGAWITDGRMSGPIPNIHLVKNFVGDIDLEAEKNVSEFYSSVLEFVLENEITEQSRIGDDGETLLELKEDQGFDLHENISNSTPILNTKYGPKFSIRATQPQDESYPELVKVNDSRFQRKKMQDIITLHYYSNREY